MGRWSWGWSESQANTKTVFRGKKKNFKLLKKGNVNRIYKKGSYSKRKCSQNTCPKDKQKVFTKVIMKSLNMDLTDINNRTGRGERQAENPDPPLPKPEVSTMR